MDVQTPPLPRVLAAVALGGAVGAVLRAGVDTSVGSGAGFPWGTFVVNVVGCGLLALLPAAGWVRRRPLLPPLLGTGVLGGFTTMSAFAEDARVLLSDGQAGLAAAYVGGTVGACLAVVALVDLLSSRADRAQFEAEEGDL